ncbi:MAG: rhodanese-like domain-containing protein [Desulfobulbaceae bacterium]|nr:rhodanese-like domain-containing protein [Desulfobulbaceae bacterium]
MQMMPCRKALGLAALLLAGCAGTIDRPSLAIKLSAPENRLALVDVRTPGEYQGGHLPGAVNLPVQELPFRMEAVRVQERREPVIVYCSHGFRAGLAGFFLRLAGFSAVWHLQGDIRGWREAGQPLVTGPEPGVLAK